MKYGVTGFLRSHQEGRRIFPRHIAAAGGEYRIVHRIGAGEVIYPPGWRLVPIHHWKAKFQVQHWRPAW